ncbi:MAG: sensor histidine kinase [Xanthomonadales bacterium]|nr:sensor histidine kinase [Xanthomonadales bacterium]
MNLDAPKASADLPDFCQPRAVFILVLLGLLLALLLALAGRPDFSGFWFALGLNALMVETVVLASSLLLCACRGFLVRLPPAAAFATIFLVIQVLVVGFSWLAARYFLPYDSLDPGGGEWILRNLLISLVASLVFVRYLMLHRQWQVQVRAEAGARLEALQARIRPHFLFNTLNTIASLVRTRPNDAEQAVLDLADLLRSGLRTNATHTLGEELELVRGYLRIESQRLGERLGIDWHVDAELPISQTIPALLVQPLVENAVVHGIARLPDGGRLEISAGARGKAAWFVRVKNPWPGAAEDAAGGADGNRMALANIRQRLELAFGGSASLETHATGNDFTAELRVPIAAPGD